MALATLALGLALFVLFFGLVAAATGSDTTHSESTRCST